ncbi:MAG: peptidylprolyl isomerase [Sulfuricellaceae bacterium]|jgi:FKBP-type peptidyl-prolyl cis-trans isomerase SlyD
MAEQKVAKHKVIYLTYSIIDDAGSVFEQSDVPVGYIHGVGSDLFEQIEHALDGKAVGERVEVTLSAEEGFGPHRPELTFTDDIDNVPPEFRYIGAEVEFENERGESMQFRVTRIEDGKLTIDANHPLAGKTITFVVDVADIRDATPDEIANGVPADSASCYLQ